MLSLLRRRADDPAVVELIGRDPALIERSAYQGFVQLKNEGVSVIFKEAPWVILSTEITDPAALHVAAFHLHRDGHEGYAGYSGQLPNDVSLEDSEADLVGKMGEPSAIGGGGMSTVLKRPIARWLRYLLGEAILQFQMDTDGRVDMATLYSPDTQLG